MRPSSAQTTVSTMGINRAATVTIRHQNSLAQKIAQAATPRGRKSSNGSAKDNCWDPELLRLEICEELLQELTATPEVVFTLIAQVEKALVDWFQHQAPETLKGRLTKQEFKDTLELLTDDKRVSFFITLFNFMHQEFVRNSPSFPHHLEKKVMGGSLSRQLSTNSSNLSRSSSFRLMSSSSFKGNSMPMPVMQTSLWQNMDKYDLGYKHWSKEKKFEADLAAKLAAAKAASVPRMSVPSAGSHARPTSAISKTKSMIKRGVSFNSHAQHAPSHHAHHKEKDGADSRPRISHAGSSASSFASRNESNAPRRIRPVSGLRFADPGHSPVRGTNPKLGMGSFRRPGVNASSTSGASARTATHPGAASPAALSMSQAAKRSLANLPSMKLLSAAVAQATAGPTKMTSQDDIGLQQSRLFVLQQEFAGLYQQARQSRAGMFFTLPVFLVTARLLVHMLFTGLYRLWAKTNEGHEAIQQMDEALEHLFDPHGYLQRNLSILQSSPAAVSVMTKHPHKSHEPERLHFADVSPLMRAAMTDPASAGARKLMFQGAQQQRTRKAARKPSGGEDRDEYEEGLLEGWSGSFAGPLTTKLTKLQQEALFRMVQEQTRIAQPVLSTLGDPV